MFRLRIHSAAILIVLLAALQAVFHLNRGGLNRSFPGESIALELSLLPVHWLTWPFRQASKAWDHYVSILNVTRENRELRSRITELERELSRLREVESEADRLRGLLEFKGRSGLTASGAGVVALSRNGSAINLFVGRGAKDGVIPPATVIGPQGVVGRVVSVSPSFSKVLPITDGASAVAVLVQRSREQGILKGAGGNRCRMVHVPVGADVAVGDTLVTSGLDGIYPGGLAIGSVSRVERPPGAFFADIEVVPATRISQLEEVLVVPPPSPTPEEEFSSP